MIKTKSPKRTGAPKAAFMAKPAVAPQLPDNYGFVLEIIRGSDRQHLTAPEIHELAKKARPGIGFTTVYRALLRLRDLGMVTEFPSPDGRFTVYDRNLDKHSHIHCRRCGMLVDVHITVPSSLWAKDAAQLGFLVTTQSFTLEGVCARCQQKAGD